MKNTESKSVKSKKESSKSYDLLGDIQFQKKNWFKSRS